MVSKYDAALRGVLVELEAPVVFPDSVSASAQDSWMELMELAGRVAGLVVTALSGGRIRAMEVSGARDLLDSSSSWWTDWPLEAEIIRRACDALDVVTR